MHRPLPLHSADLPSLSVVDKVRSLYDRDRPTARLVGRTAAEVETPLVRVTGFFRCALPPIQVNLNFTRTAAGLDAFVSSSHEPYSHPMYAIFQYFHANSIDPYRLQMHT